MNERDRQSLLDIAAVLDRALGFPIPSLEIFQRTDYLQDALVRCLEVFGLQAIARYPSPDCRDPRR